MRKKRLRFRRVRGARRPLSDWSKGLRISSEGEEGASVDGKPPARLGECADRSAEERTSVDSVSGARADQYRVGFCHRSAQPVIGDDSARPVGVEPDHLGLGNPNSEMGRDRGGGSDLQPSGSGAQRRQTCEQQSTGGLGGGAGDEHGATVVLAVACIGVGERMLGEHPEVERAR